MAELIALLAVALIGLALIAGVLLYFCRDGTTTGTVQAINANHHDLYLLVNDLVAVHDRGGMLVFPDQDTLDRAHALLLGYRAQMIAAGPPAPATPAN